MAYNRNFFVLKNPHAGFTKGPNVSGFVFMDKGINILKVFARRNVLHDGSSIVHNQEVLVCAKPDSSPAVFKERNHYTIKFQ
ncbi:hypothetical protein D3C87_1533120 [compost metagenome]